MFYTNKPRYCTSFEQFSEPCKKLWLGAKVRDVSITKLDYGGDESMFAQGILLMAAHFDYVLGGLFYKKISKLISMQERQE